MSAPTRDIHERVFDEIDERIKTLRSGAPAADSGSGAWTQDEVDAELAQLENDRDVLVAHWKTRNGRSVAADRAPMRAKACGEPQACTHVRDLAQKYGV